MAISFIKKLKDKAQKIRTTIEEGSTTLRELRAEVEGTVDSLKADSEEKLMDIVTEIQESVEVFEEAGYELIGLRIEMGFNPKVVPKIRRISEISDRDFRKLVDEHKDREVVVALLRALRKAEQLEDKVKIPNLVYESIEIEVGVVPSVHINWAVPVINPEAKTATITAQPTAPTSAETVEEDDNFTTFKYTSSYGSSSSSEAGYSSPSHSSTTTESAQEEKPEKAEVKQEATTQPQQTGGLSKWMTFPKVD